MIQKGRKSLGSHDFESCWRHRSSRWCALLALIASMVWMSGQATFGFHT